MFTTLLLFLFLLPDTFAATNSPTSHHYFYTAFESSEALVEFSHWVNIDKTEPLSEYQAQRQIEKQIAHLFGPLAANKFPAVPKTDHEIQILEVHRISKNVQRIGYSYRGHFAVRFGINNKLRIVLPNNPDKIYQAGEVGFNNPCTDAHYQGEGDFWYFWNQ